MAVTEAELKETYRRLSDEKLMRIASREATTLRPEALVLLKAELGARGLAETAERAIAAQFRVVSEPELAEYCGLIQAQPCPVCRSAAQRLNAALISKVASFVVLTTWKKQLAIACPPCLDKLNREASISTALLGWWGFPWGIFRTIQALLANAKAEKTHHLLFPTELLQAFVLQNVGRIEAARATPADLQALLRPRP